MKYIVTGCAGFIGSNLVERILENSDNIVIGIDNLSTGNFKFLEKVQNLNNFYFHEIDLFTSNDLNKIFKGGDIVFHLAANADVRYGIDHPRKDLEQNTIVTQNILEAMLYNDIKRIVFSSTGSVYGEATTIPTPEDAAFPVQTSFYGASKTACEGLISAFCESFGMQGFIYRFVSILGERYNHGHVYDFYLQLKKDPKKLVVLGNGKQRKSYLYIQDCIDAIFLSIEKSKQNINIFNLGTNEYCEVNDSIAWICEELSLSPQKQYGNQNRGWVGDNPFIFLDTKKISRFGWKPKLTIKEGIIKTVKYLKNNEWIFNSRK